jgi:tetratricopeptide (TPR) repeat protein
MKSTKEIISNIRSTQLLDDANACIASGKYYDALHCVNTFLLLHPEDVKGLLLKGLCYLYTDQSAKARYMFDLALESYPDNDEAYYCYAEYYKLEMNYEAATQYINAAMACGSENATYLRFAAELSLLQEDYEQAFQLINRAIVINPFREDVYYWRALILMRLQKNAVAINDLNRALSLNPTFADAYRLRASLHMQQGEIEAGLADIKRAQRHETLNRHAQRNAA